MPHRVNRPITFEVEIDDDIHSGVPEITQCELDRLIDFLNQCSKASNGDYKFNFHCGMFMKIIPSCKNS